MKQNVAQKPDTFTLQGKTFIKLAEPMKEFSYECQETKRGVYGHSIQLAKNGDSSSAVKLKIYGVRSGKLTLQSEVVISEVDQNEPVSTVPISKLLHANFLFKCLQQQTQLS